MAGRKPTPGRSAAARAHAEAEKARYQKLPVSERKKIVQTRDRTAQQEADNRRYAKDDSRKASRSTGNDAAQRKARATAAMAVSTGTLKKRGVCSSCGKKGSTHMHHASYDKPLAVKELCSGCHGAADRASPGSGRG